jgi:hypothetical protein
MKPLSRWMSIIAMLPASLLAADSPFTIDTSVAKDWRISNGVLSVDWNSQSGHIFSIHLAGYTDNLIDVTNTSSGEPKGFYMDNTGLGAGTVTSSYEVTDKYIDWWFSTASGQSNAFSYSQHFILAAGDPGIHTYFVVNHGADDIAGSLGQIQFLMRVNLQLFPNTYAVNTGLNNLGATIVPQPAGNSEPGRQVQDATVDLHGLPLPDGFRRQFYTKYDYSSYEYLHQVHGVFGDKLAAWTILPSRESMVGGPTKQDLIFTNNILIMECQSNHLDNQFAFPVAAGATLNRLYGPFYFRFNAFDATHTTPASLYFEALESASPLSSLYDQENALLQDGYISSNDRGRVQVFLNGAEHTDLNTTWAVLSDPQTNFQYSHLGRQYWENVNPGGVASFDKIVPGPYRLSAYVLGEWGELRIDNVDVGTHQPTMLNLQFTPENFGDTAPIWTIGAPDRSSHEFLHGQVNSPIDLDPNYSDEFTNRLGTAVQDDRQYWGNWNYWDDFASTNGAVVYYATPVGSTPATNDLSKWNYNQWRVFNPGLFAGIYNPADITTDGYKYICPAYVGNCATAVVPDWQVHFTTTVAQQAQGQFVVLSMGLAATEATMTISLNGHPLVWHGFNLKNADAAVRSGFSGIYQWVALEWDASFLNPPGADNVITFNVNRTQGVMYDALRLEITNKSSAPEVTGWSDYEYITADREVHANDAVANNNQ